MSQADELINKLTNDEISAYTTDPSSEPHIIIKNDRSIILPEELQRIAVQFDHNIETVTFDCPRYWDGIDMSGMKVYINYLRSDNVKGIYIVEDITIDETNTNLIHFDWIVSKDAVSVKGRLIFLVCIRKTDEEGYEMYRWNSELCQDMYISEGLECEESILQKYPSIITDLLTRMDGVEELANPENMQRYVSEYLNNDPKLQQTVADGIYDYLVKNNVTSAENMKEYVAEYFTKNPLLFVVGPTKPGVRSLWFDTGNSVEADSNVTLKLSSGSTSEGVYAVIEGETNPITNFTVKYGG